jgi:hypothetical protein
MKNILSSFSVLLFSCFILLFSSQAHAGDAVVKMKYVDANIKNAAVELTWHVNATNCKMEMKYDFDGKSTSSVFIPDLPSNNIFMYDVKADGKNKILFTLPVATLKGDTRFLYNKGKAKVTKEEKIIAGIPCQKVIFTTERFVCEFWVATSLPDVSRWANFFQSYPELAAITDAELKGFPLASTIKDLSGKLIASFEATSVSQAAISKEEFQVPQGYTKAEDIGRK